MFLEQAYSLACAIPESPHAVERNALLTEVADAALASELPALARTCAFAVTDWRRGLILGHLARWQVAVHAPGFASDLADAETFAASLSDNRRRDAVYLAASEVRLQRGERLTGEQLVRISEDQRFTMIPFDLPNAADKTEASNYLKRLDTARTGRCDFELLGALADGYRRLYSHPSGADLRTASVKGFDTVTVALPVLIRESKVAGMIPVAAVAGDAALAQRLFTNALALARSLAPEFRAQRMADLSEIGGSHRLQELGRIARDEAVAALDAPGMGECERPAAAARVARELWRSGENQRARALVGQAIGTASRWTNARPRVVAAVRVCCEAARAGMPSDASVLKQIEDLRAALHDPW